MRQCILSPEASVRPETGWTGLNTAAGAAVAAAAGAAAAGAGEAEANPQRFHTETDGLLTK